MHRLTAIFFAFGLTTQLLAYEYENVRVDPIIESILQENPSLMDGAIRLARIQGILCLVSTSYAEARSTRFSDAKEAEKIAILDGRKEMIAFLGGQRISAMDFVSVEAETMNDVSSIKEVFSSKSQSEIEGLIRGVRQVGSWKIANEPVYFVAQLLKLDGLMSGGVEPAPSGQRSIAAPDLNADEENLSSGSGGPQAISGAEGGSEIVVISSGVFAYLGNREISRSKAINQACQEAIRQGLGQIIDSTQMVSNGQLVEKVLSQSEGFITDYKVINEGVNGDVYRVEIRASVTKEKLTTRAMEVGLLKSMVGNPRVSIIAMEINLRNGQFEGVKQEDSEQLLTMLEGAFAGFDIRPTDMKQQLLNFQTRFPEKFEEIQLVMDRMRIEGEFEFDIQKFGRLGTEADLIVTGRVALNDLGYDSDGIRNIFEAQVTLKILYASTGEILGTVVDTVRAGGNSADMALQNACEKMLPRTKELISDTLKQWADMANNGITIQLYVQNIPDRYIARSFRRELGNILGVSSVEIASQDGDEMNFQIIFKGTNTTFTNNLDDWIFETIQDRLDEIGSDLELRSVGNRTEVIFKQ